MQASMNREEVSSSYETHLPSTAVDRDPIFRARGNKIFHFHFEIRRA